MAGDFNTGFIAEQFPKGFSAAAVVHEQPEFLLVLAAAAHRRLRGRAAGITGQLAGHEMEIGDDFVVSLLGADGRGEQTALEVRGTEPHFEVTLAGHTHPITLHGQLRDIAVHGSFAGQPFCAQVERIGLNYRINHNGTQVDARVLSRRAAELTALMPFKAPPDLSKFLLSPMPGLLADVAVEAGQTVRAGEKLAVIEAMKMENILVAAQDGVVAEVAARKGESLSVDQIVIRFA